MRIAVLGGTGTLGVLLVQELESRRHEVRSLSRNSLFYPVDLETGFGLDRAIAGCDVVVDASNAVWGKRSRDILVRGTRRLLDAEKSARVSHHVCISIIGCEKVPASYYKNKSRQEQIVREGVVPWSIVRATQFHELLAGAFSLAARWRLLPSPAIPLQTVACIEVAGSVADIVESSPRYRQFTISGPQIVDMTDMARQWRAVTGRKVILMPIPLWGKLRRALREGVLTDPDPDIRGRVSFEEWLKSHIDASAKPPFTIMGSATRTPEPPR